MPALESSLTVLLLVLAAVAVFAGLGATAGRPMLRRAWRYFVTWWERDKIAEREARRLAECRKQAEAEIREACGEVTPDKPETTVTTTEATASPSVQQVRR